MSKRKLVSMIAVLVGFAEVASAQAVDYSRDESWLCRPGRQDACAIDLTTTIISADATMTVEVWAADPDPPIDCFYVYPTVSTDPDQYSDMSPDPAELNVVRQQFARFASKCRTYAPMYRQVTLAGLRSGGGGTALGSGPQYDDVVAAWKHYLEHDNQGRGFVLVSHSQGTYILTELVRNEIDGKPIQSRLVSALLIGATVPVAPNDASGESFGSVPVCTSADQIGCLIAYSAFRSTVPPPESTLFGRVTTPGLRAACVNPAALGGGTGELHAFLSVDGRTITGQTQPPPWVSPERPIETPWVSVPGLLTARCVENEYANYLEVTVHGNPSDPRTDDIIGDIGAPGRPSPNWGLHLVDINIAMGDLVEIVGRQAEAWQARR